MRKACSLSLTPVAFENNMKASMNPFSVRGGGTWSGGCGGGGGSGDGEG